MKRFSILILLLAFGIFVIGIGKAETEKSRGKIELSIPNTPTPTTEIEINLDESFFRWLFIDLTMDPPEYGEYAEMFEGIFICSCVKESRILTEMNTHFQKILKTEKWERILKVQDHLNVSLLFSETPGILNGIFVSFTDENNTTFVNIYGNIDLQKLGTLIQKFIESEAWFPKDIKINTKFKMNH